MNVFLGSTTISKNINEVKFINYHLFMYVFNRFLQYVTSLVII